MKRTKSLMPVTAVLLLVATVGCTHHQTVMVPPRLDLARHELIGVIEFDSSSKGGLAPLATRRFTELARRDQGMVRMVELGSPSQALASVGASAFSGETFKALGQKHGVRTILIGELTVSDVRPDLKISTSWRSGSLSANVDATLAVQLIETSTGASLWNRSARATRSVGHVSVLGGKNVAFDADDPERAYGDLINALADQVTRDFRVSWERR